MRYEEKALELIAKISQQINKVANILNITPQLIASAIAEEYTSSLQHGKIKG